MRFHEISLTTLDIRASVEFYERLGFSQAITTDTWSHPYGVLTDGRAYLGLHQRRAPSPMLTFVQPGIAAQRAELEQRGFTLTTCRTGEDIFNELGFRDPLGQAVAVLEARTFSPVSRAASETSLCGHFGEFSMPAADLTAAQTFWESLGFVAIAELATPYVRLPLVSDHLDIAFHRPRTLDRPMLVFYDPEMPARIARLRALGVSFSDELPRGLSSGENALLESPEGTALLLLCGEGS